MSMQRGITVTGSGAAAGPRDRCLLEVGAESRARTADVAMTQAGAALAAIRAALLEAGVAEASLASGGVSLSPEHDPWPTVSGYVASLRLSAVAPDATSAGALVGAVVAAGGDDARVHGVTFDHADPAALERAARDAAFTDARAKAEQLAALAGRELGQVLAVSDAVVMAPSPRPMFARAVMVDAAPMPVDAGEGAVTVSLQVRWSLA